MRMYPRVKDETGKNDIDNNSVDEIENANNSDKDKDKDDSKVHCNFPLIYCIRLRTTIFMLFKPISELAEYFKNYTTKKSLSNLLMVSCFVIF